MLKMSTHDDRRYGSSIYLWPGGHYAGSAEFWQNFWEKG